MTGYNILSTRCPILNKAYRGSSLSNTPDLEVVLKYKILSDDVKIEGVICPKYGDCGECYLLGEEGEDCEDCIFKQGFKSTKIEDSPQ